MDLGRLVVALIVGVTGCAGPGVLSGPGATTQLRTARYRIGISDGGPELVVLLSNGVFDCGVAAFDDAIAQSAAEEALYVAACREGAQHVALHAYASFTDAGWAGAFPGADDAAVSTLGEDRPRLSRGLYYSVEEAFLVEIDGLSRGYQATEDTYLPELGDGGRVELDPETDDPVELGTLRGSFAFPVDGVSGRFVAEPCAGDTQLLDVLAVAPTYYCKR